MKGLILAAVLLVTVFAAGGQSPKPDRLTRLDELLRTGTDPGAQSSVSLDDGSADLAVIRAALASPSRQRVFQMERTLHRQGLDTICPKLSEQEVTRVLLLSIWWRSESSGEIRNLGDEIEELRKDVTAIKKRLGIDDGSRPMSFP